MAHDGFHTGKRADLNPLQKLGGLLGGGLEADWDIFKRGWLATGGAIEDAGKAFYNSVVNFQPEGPMIQSLRSGGQAEAGESQERVYGQPSFPPSIAAPLAVDPSGIMDVVRPDTQRSYEVPGTTIMGETPVAPLAEGVFSTRGQGQGLGTPGEGTKGVYKPPEEEVDKKKWADVIAGLAALSEPKKLPAPSLTLNQIPARTVQGGGGAMTPFNPDNTASTAFKDRNITPQILKFLR